MFMNLSAMKKSYLISIILFLFTAFSTYAQQNLRTAYFLDGYTYGYKLNPAFQGERGFFAIPVLGKTSLGLESNLALSTFLYPTADGKLATFLHPDVTSDEFLSKMRFGNKALVNVDLPVFALGFRTGEMYHTLDLSVRADVGANLTKDLFKFIKVGSADGTDKWNLSNLGARGEARMEVAYGLSRPIGDIVTVGARVKMLMGLAKADIAMDNLSLKMNGEEWAVSAKGLANISGPFTIQTKGHTGNAEDPSQSNVLDWSSIAFPETTEEIIDYFRKPSIGFAVDLGVTVNLLEYITLSAAVLDLGVMSWKDMLKASTPEASWSFAGFENLSLNEDDPIGDQFGDITEEFMDVINVSKDGVSAKAATPLSATIHLGAEAKMPFYERLSFGLLGTQKIAGPYSWTEGRLSMNLAPLRWFSLSASGAISTFGTSLGGAVNLHMPGLTLFVGLDSFSPLLNMTPQFVPIDALNTNVTLGLNFAFGSYNGKFPRD